MDMGSKVLIPIKHEDIEKVQIYTCTNIDQTHDFIYTE